MSAGDELETPAAGTCADCARRGDLIQGIGTAAVIALIGAFLYASYRAINKPPDFDAALDAYERRELLREAAADEAPPEA